MKRDVDLVEDCYYHVFNKSIQGFKIFLSQNEYFRMVNTLRYYQMENTPMALSQFLALKEVQGAFLYHLPLFLQFLPFNVRS